MKNQNIEIGEENAMSTGVFDNYLKDYQKKHAQNIPVILLIAKAKEIAESDGDSDDRKIDVPQYGNSRMDAFYFHKPISTIIKDD